MVRLHFNDFFHFSLFLLFCFLDFGWLSLDKQNETTGSGTKAGEGAAVFGNFEYFIGIGSTQALH